MKVYEVRKSISDDGKKNIEIRVMGVETMPTPNKDIVYFRSIFEVMEFLKKDENKGATIS